MSNVQEVAALVEQLIKEAGHDDVEMGFSGGLLRAAATMLKDALPNMEIGRLVRAKLTGLNKIPVERCTITAVEVYDIESIIKIRLANGS